MTQALDNLKHSSDPSGKDWEKSDFLSLRIAGQLFGIPVLQVQDILGDQKITPVPLSSPEISGALNLRGRIVTAINVRKKLGLPDTDEHQKDTSSMSVVVGHKDDLYSLIIDSVGDVLSLSDKRYEANPTTLDAVWRDVSSGIYRLDTELLIVLDIPKLLGFAKQ